MANKLKNMLLKSVDLVRRGANPDADIKLYKSIDGGPDGSVQAIMKSHEQIQEMIQKSGMMIDDYTGILAESLTSIINDSTLTSDAAREMMVKSISEFNNTIFEDVVKGFSYEQGAESGVNEMKYSDLMKSGSLNDGEREQLGALLAKACGKKIDKAGEMDDMDIIIEGDAEEEDGEPPFKPKGEEGMNKSYYEAIIQQQGRRIEELQKRFEMGDLVEFAKKYEAIGEKPEELAKTLYEMKAAGGDIYKTYVANLDKTLELFQKSGIFGEIGKSYGSPSGGMISKSGIEAQIENFASAIMKADPRMSHVQAVAKAWEDHPELSIEYENSRR